MLDIQTFKDKKGEWRWRMVERRSKKIVATSGEGYERRATMKRTLTRIISQVQSFFYIVDPVFYVEKKGRK